MSISIKWLLESSEDSFKFNLLAGDSNSSTTITGVNIIDNPSTVPWLKEGTLVLSTGYLFQDEQITKTLIEDLHDKKCAGLGIKMNRYLNDLPVVMKEQADKLGFPIINIPFSSTMEQITSLIYRKLFSDEMSEAEKINLVYKELSESIFKRNNLKNILSIIGSHLNSDIYLTNDAFEVIERYSTENTPYEYPFDFSTNSLTLFPESDVIFLKNHYYSTTLPYINHMIKSDKYGSIEFGIFSIVNRNTPIGFLVVLKTQDTLIDAYDFIDNIHSMICIAMMNFSITTESERSNRDIFFNNLLSGEYTDIDSIEKMCHQNHFEYNRSRICSYIRIPNYEALTIAQRRAMERKIFSIFSGIYPDFNLTIKSTVFRTNFILFIFPNTKNDDYSFELEAKKLTQKCLEAIESIDPLSKAGCSSPLYGADTIITSYRQAAQALELGEQLDSNAKSVYLYSDNRIYHELTNHYSRADMQDLYNSQIGLLDIYDQKNQSQLIKSLETYIQNGQNVTKSAQELFIHRNTMFYRLDQIKELLHVDLNNINTIYMLQTGLYIRKILMLE